MSGPVGIVSTITTVGEQSESAAAAAAWVMEQGLEVTWLWTFIHCRIRSAWASVYPMRQPVMAKLFDRALTTATLSGCLFHQWQALACPAGGYTS